MKDFLVDEEDIKKRQEEEEKKNTRWNSGGWSGSNWNTTNTIVTITPVSQPKVDKRIFIQEEDIRNTEVLETFLIKENEKYQKILLLDIDKTENNENSQLQNQENKTSKSTKTSKLKLPERLSETGFAETILALISIFISIIILRIKKYSHK